MRCSPCANADQRCISIVVRTVILISDIILYAHHKYIQTCTLSELTYWGRAACKHALPRGSSWEPFWTKVLNCLATAAYGVVNRMMLISTTPFLATFGFGANGDLA